MEKICNLCRQSKPLDDFYVMKKAPDGRGYTCKECSRVRRRQWGEDNPERVRENQHTYWQRHADEKNTARREKNASDPEYRSKRAAQRRRRYERDSEADRAASKAWRESDAGRAWRAE